MNISSKNKLQEKFQKNGKVLPKYHTIMDENKMWISEVEIYDGKKYAGMKCNKKTEAENSAATIALSDDINEIKKNIYDRPRTVFLIDLENMPKIIEELNENKYMDIFIFVGEHHNLVKKEYKL